MTPYEDGREHLLDELARLDLLLRVHLERWWAERPGGDEFRGLYVSDQEVDHLLGPDPGGVAREPDGGSEPTAGSSHGGDAGPGAGSAADQRADGRQDALLDRYEAVARTVRARERATAGTDVELRLVEVCERFDLDSLHRDALLLAVAPELDSKYEKVYAYLQDDVTRTRPTAGLAVRVLYRSAADRLDARSLFASQSPLVRHRLVRRGGDESAPLLSRVLQVDDRVVEYLLGGDAVADELQGVASVREPGGSPADLPLDDEPAGKLAALADRYPDDGGPQLCYFHGRDGSGRERAVEATVDGPTLRVDAGALAPEALHGHLGLLRREAALQGAVLHVANLSTLGDGDGGDGDDDDGAPSLTPADVLLVLDAVDGPVFCSGAEPVSPGLQARLDDHEFVTLAFPTQSYDLRRRLWAQVEALPADADPADLAGKFRLTAGGIEDAVSTARALGDGRDVTVADLYAGCRAQSQAQLGTLAHEMEPTYTWDDIVLPDDRERQLREVALHVEHRGTVYDDWGFEEKYSLGNGVNVLFTGPSGTGKTMAAEVIASDAGLDLYRVDLSNVVSKYIGETESNLQAIFDEAEHSNAILFFDEADALFGERTEVSDSHDRYANVEVSYLLQRMEAHDGAVLLASNLRENIDDAFLRRINVSIDFPLPDRDARAEIWRAVFPADVPLGDLDVPFLASFELPGGNVKNAALTAAFLAADDGGRVEMRHVVRALERELDKTGRLITPDAFGEYGDLLER